MIVCVLGAAFAMDRLFQELTCRATQHRHRPQFSPQIRWHSDATRLDLEKRSECEDAV